MFNLIKELIVKYQKPIKYLISGTTAAVVEYSLFNFIFYLTLTQTEQNKRLLIAQIISYLSGLLVAFTLHHFWTFKTKDQKDQHHSSQKQFFMYSAVSLTNLVLTTCILSFLKNNLHIAPWLAKFITMGMVVLWNFLIMNKIIFKPLDKSEDSDGKE